MTTFCSAVTGDRLDNWLGSYDSVGEEEEEEGEEDDDGRGCFNANSV